MPLPKYQTWFYSFIVTYCGLSVLQAILNYSSFFLGCAVPGINASYGASAVLIYGANESPLAQPYALILCHFLSALSGVCITKLFSLMPNEAQFHFLCWLAASLSSAVTIMLMQVTETTHPRQVRQLCSQPRVTDTVWEMSWYYLPIVVLSSTWILAVAPVVNYI
ncbi:hypothetical protein ETB97_006952 [Aspergillus alliaceus]|uniref:HPP transmembrane region domain-containing protein n=1 Tax=Petromyces alliaceus TaxID=209559 RepID=A0A8H6EBE3_PETAA|nr:hypothetical protein ETB97_006952 [Aspergillus burnettii]